ncbi:DEKNAAC102177 [Brettanomyces naardenensis]|uniref:Mediator of RNA polymerase II transcription subunit 8 n=1 Tax=Brettanomyces naardenensis TaxID=13370 RepID=A0A448YK58_BRENA|nr:DEKNAAC102177 [Brettanomyces naardenensis]
MSQDQKPQNKDQTKYPALNLQEVPVLPLEQVRPRLSQLTHSLRKLEDMLRASRPLPNWTTVQNQFNVILSQLTSFSRTLDANRDPLSSSDVYPNYDFDTTQHEGLLTTLLRKKHLPEVDEWINSADVVDMETIRKDEEITRRCIEIVEQLLQNYVFGGYITKEEGEQGVRLEDIFGKRGNEPPVEPKGLSEGDILRFVYQGLDSNIESLSEVGDVKLHR